MTTATKKKLGFWEQVERCDHSELYDDYCEDPGCSMSHLDSWATEVHCKKCGAYIAECGCGCTSGISGWPAKRWRNAMKKRPSSALADEKDDAP